MKRILIADDNPDILDALDLLFSLSGYQVSTATTIKEALLALAYQKIDLLIQDMNFSEGTTSGEEGKKLFYQVRKTHPTLPIIIITAWSQLETAIELVKSGASDYLPKPWKDNKLLEVVHSHLATTQQNKALSTDQLIYHSEAMQSLMATATKVANAQINVLITGPNGSGKERLADFIHQNSSRAGQPFIKVNMGALPHDLMEAELFGAEKGAFTGANNQRQGRFESADGGTLFLDEIANLSLSGQMKLLRVLQSGEFERLGSSKTQKVDVRIISATNSDLRQAVNDGSFREDLFYRLNIVELMLPALKQRKADIIPLAKLFIGSDKILQKCAKTALESHPWPGNVRELENSCKRALVFASDNHLSAHDFNLTSQPIVTIESEKEKINNTLIEYNWVISKAATELQLSRQALYRRIEKYQLKEQQ
ncbi:MAG: sigma-54-dependent Fis family transcriptional regulator [Psychromonas sp.]|nr:sigma-54-dependent Fis family transcriptional regulator [Psychromonas sp.]